MATLYQVPIPVTSNETIRVQLDGSTYTFTWTWNERDGRWFLSLYDVEGLPVVQGLCAVVGWDILLDVTVENRPPGRLLFFDESTTSTSVYGLDPGEDDLGDRVYCYYLPPDQEALL